MDRGVLGRLALYAKGMNQASSQLPLDRQGIEPCIRDLSLYLHLSRKQTVYLLYLSHFEYRGHRSLP
jgi:hypothetical protein